MFNFANRSATFCRLFALASEYLSSVRFQPYKHGRYFNISVTAESVVASICYLGQKRIILQSKMMGPILPAGHSISTVQDAVSKLIKHISEKGTSYSLRSTGNGMFELVGSPGGHHG